MKEIILIADQQYTCDTVKAMIETALQNERDEVKAKYIINSVYSLNEIYDNKKVLEEKNILACDYKFKQLIPAIELIGFDAVNKIIINKHEVKKETPKVETNNDNSK